TSAVRTREVTRPGPAPGQGRVHRCPRSGSKSSRGVRPQGRRPGPGTLLPALGQTAGQGGGRARAVGLGKLPVQANTAWMNAQNATGGVPLAPRHSDSLTRVFPSLAQTSEQFHITGVGHFERTSPFGSLGARWKSTTM